MLEITHQSTYKNTLEARDELLWNSLVNATLGDALQQWLETIPNPRTKKAYTACAETLLSSGLLKGEMPLSHFSLINLESVVDLIKVSPVLCPLSEATRQLTASCFISFTGFLCRRSQGFIRKAMSSKEGLSRTFFKVRDKVKTEAIQTKSERDAFFRELDKISRRDGLLARVMLQGGKRISEVLGLTTDRISYATCTITFSQSKTRGTQQETVITYSQEIMNALREYIGERTGLVFVTFFGKRVHPTQLNRNFKTAGRRAEIPFPVSPHVLRVTCVTYLQTRHDVKDTDIMKVTGHASSDMIAMYDKSSRADNASRRFNIV